MVKINFYQPTSVEEPLFFESLNKLQIDLHTLTELNQVLESLVYVGRDLLNCDDTSIVLWNSAQKDFVEGASTTTVGAEVPKRVRRKKGATRWIIENQKAKFVEDTQKDRVASNSMITENHIGAYGGVPILFDGESLGVFYALFRHKQVFENDEQHKLKHLANVASISIKHAMQIQVLEERNQFLTTLTSTTLQKMIQPLSLAMGFCDLMANELQGMSAEYKKRVDVIQRSHNQMHNFITEFQRFEKLMTNYDLEFEPVSINYVAYTVQDAFKGVVKDDNLNKNTVQLITDDSVPTVYGDLYLLVELVKELVNRVMQFSSENGPVTIKTVNHINHVMIGVEEAQDYPSTEQKKFGDFQPIQTKLTSNESLTGLGLKYVKVIVEMHGGYVHIEGLGEKGSEFQIFLPKSSDIN